MTKTHRGTRTGATRATTATVARPAVAPAAPRTPAGLPGWLTGSGLALAVVGLLVSAYLVYEHFTQGASFACPEGEVVNCQKVTQSAWSSFAGVPVAVLGLLWFLPVVALCLPRAWQQRRFDAPRIALLALGTVMVLYLVWAELFAIGSICLWCTVVHVVTVLLLALALLGWALRPRT